MRRTDLLDTSDWAHREMVRMLRKLTPSQRLAMMFDRIEVGLEISRMAKSRIAEQRRPWAQKKF